MKSLLLLLLAAGIALLSGCAAYPMNGSTYSNSYSLRSQRTEVGTVIAVRKVAMVNRTNNAGGAVGALLGGLAGRTVGNGIGRDIATVAGALGGAVLGSEAEKHISGRRSALQITVQGQYGQLHTVVQPQDGTGYLVGQKVLVIQGGNQSRVSPLEGQA